MGEGATWPGRLSDRHRRAVTCMPRVDIRMCPFLQPFVAADNVHILRVGESHWSLLVDLLAELTHPSGDLFFDVRTVVLMREHGIRRIYTTDTDFLQFAGIEVVNPLRS